MTATLPPRWFVRSAWVAHKALLRVSADRIGLSRPTPGGKFGMLRLHTVGRRSGRPRAVLLGYIEDSGRFVTLAMNGWNAADPAWWHNLQAHPAASVDLAAADRREVTAHEATGAERERLWAALHDYSGYGDLDAHATQRGRETAVVVLTPAASPQ
ncbi:nitroreductase/quinone reductase family protein [Actinoplanes sp. NPDC049596]|uniref:nitroreductase/quinone reductase family protein n=1 Tax=unclassified Actinoplanes TaxID=2626549 RepID=UPI00342169F3